MQDLSVSQKAYIANLGLMDDVTLNSSKSTAELTASLNANNKMARVSAVGAKLLGAALNAAISIGISLAISAIIELTQWEKELAENAQKAADKYNELTESVSTYGNRIKELYDKINSGNLTLEEHVEANKELREIQSELIDNFGEEAAGIDLVTQSLEAQGDQLERVNNLKNSAAIATKYENELNKDTTAEKVWNVISKIASVGFGGILLGGLNLVNGWTDAQNIFGSNVDQMQEKYEHFSATIKATSDDTLNYLISSYDNIRQTAFGDFEIYGNVDKVRDTLLHLQADYKKFPGYTDEWADSLGEVYNKADEIAQKYGESYRQYVQMAIVANEEYLSLQEEISQAYSEYEEANIAGDTSGAEAAMRRYLSIVEQVKEEVASTTYQDAIINIVPQIVSPNTGEFETLVNEYINGKFNLDKNLGIQIPIGFDDSDVKTFAKVQRMYERLSKNAPTFLKHNKIYSLGQLFDKLTREPDFISDLSAYGLSFERDITNIQDKLQTYIDWADSGVIVTDEFAKSVNWFGSDFTRLVAIIEQNGSAVSWDDLLAFNDFQNTLQAIENELGISADEIKNILLRRGLIIQDGIKEQVRDFVNSNVTATNEDIYVRQMRVRDTDALIEQLSKLWSAEDLNNLPYIWKYLEIPPNTVPTWKQMNAALKEYYANLKEIDELASNADLPFRTVDDLADVESAVNSLSDLYWEIAQKSSESTDDIWGFADPAKINSVEQAFMKLAESEDEATQEKLTLALKDFEETLVLFPNDADKAQEAINKLVTSYINESSILDDLTEETKEYVAARLESIGVTNAEEVVESRLSDSVKSTTKAINELRDAYNDYYTVLNANPARGKNTELDEQTQQAMAKLTEDVSKAISVYGQDGKILQKFEIDDEFVKDHWDTVQRMIDGDEKAILELQKEFFRADFSTHMNITLPEEELDRQFDKLWNEMVEFSQQDMTVFASIDDTAFVQKLNEMLLLGDTTVQQLNSMLGSIGLEAVYNKKNNMLSGVKQSGDTGLGETANYLPNTNKDKSGGGGGSDSGKDPQVEAFEEALKNLEFLRDTNQISEKEYLDQLRLLIEKYYSDIEKYPEEYYKNIMDYLDKIKAYYESVLSAITSLIDDEIDRYNKLEEEEKKVYEEEKKLNDKKIKDLNKQIKAIDKEIKAYQKQQELIREENIKPLEDQIKQREKIVKSIQDEIELMQDVNDKRKDAIDLQKLQYEMERAQHQRTLLQYVEGSEGKGQLVYRNDPNAVKDAQQNLEEKEFELRIKAKQEEVEIIEKEIEGLQNQIDEYEEQISKIDDIISGLEKQKEGLNDQIEVLNEQNEALDESIEKVEEFYSKIVNGLQKYKEQWEEISEIEAQAQNLDIIRSLGLDPNAILDLDEGSLESFKSRYLGILGDIHSAQEGMMSSLQDVAGQGIGSYLQATIDQFASLQSIDLSSIASALATCQNGIFAINEGMITMQELFSQEMPDKAMEGFTEGEDSILETGTVLFDALQEMGYETMEDALENIATVSDSLEEVIAKVEDLIAKLKEAESAGSGLASAALEGHYKGTVGNAFASGYNGLPSPEKNALRSEYGQPELTVYPNGTYELTTTPTLSSLPKGTVIFNEDQTRRILEKSKQGGKAFASGTIGGQYLSLQEAMPDKAAMFDKIANAIKNGLDPISGSLFNMNRNLETITQNVTNISNAGGMNFSMGDVHISCPGVTSESVMNQIGQGIEKVFFGMAQNSYQHAHKR